MLLRMLGKDTEGLTGSEEASVSRLAAAQRRLVLEGDRVDTKSEAGFNACANFLEALATVACVLKVDAAPRSYRSAFTVNYRALFPDEARHYRVDVLEASIEQYAAIWVNGDKFEFSAEAMRRAKALQRAWAELNQMLDRWGGASKQQRPSARPPRSQLRYALNEIDFAWASFEHKYIAELIGIEEKARRLIVQAVAHEERLRKLEEGFPGEKREELQWLPEYCEEQKRLVACVAHLNSVANIRRKGRDDLGVGVLLDALAALRRCDAAERAGDGGSEALAAARVLATDVVDSYSAMREYLREVSGCLERVDPHLCNNTGLVERLVDWEESWEVGARYVQSPRLLATLCDLVSQLRHAQRLVPAFASMFQDFDAELFMILPRLLWLRFLSKPEQHAELLQGLLPVASAGDCDFDALVEKFRCTQLMLAIPALSSEGLEGEILVRRAIQGTQHATELPEPAQQAVEELMRELERWSIKLQRHCPEDWNQCSAIIVQCLTGTSTSGKAPVPFQV